ncbi:DUF2868 domain-containing protein [Marinobacter sp.]|uniref:DUF2868 domain-containing protein n=1 Tax=Marinobacter sp. TaxID=50741 RepID=UPI0035C6CDC3
MSHSPLRLLLEFDARSQRDRDQPPAFLHRRDRKFALTCEQQGRTPGVALWLEHMAYLNGPGTAPGEARRTLQLWRRINLGFAALGALLGVLTMLSLLFFEGGQRINLSLIIAFVGLHLLLALATSVQALIGWQPWRWLVRRLTPRAERGVTRRLRPLLMARAAHLGASGFALTGLVTLLLLVVVQDLAFGWSTTLTTGASAYHQLLLALATPWAWLWPAAVPDLALVEATRFFRTGTGRGDLAPELWGQWWPFVSMLWTTWVLVPRLLLTLLTQWLLRYQAGRLLASHPGWHALLYRMETPTLDTGSEHNDADDLPDTATQAAVTPLPDTDLLLCWAGAGEPELPGGLTGAGQRIFRAGGRASLADDRAVLTELAEQLAQTPQPAVLVITRSWEPPTGELLDFLAEACQRWPKSVTIALVPLSLDGQSELEPHQLRQWLRFAERLNSDRVRVSALPLAWRDPYAASGVGP